MTEELLRNLAKRTPSSFFAATRVLRVNDLRTRVARLLGLETLKCGISLAEKLLERAEDPDSLAKCGTVLNESLELSQRLLTGGVMVSGKIMVKLYFSMAELAKISDRRADQVIHLQQALEISDSAVDSSGTTAIELLLTEALVEIGNFQSAKFIGERLYDKLRRRGRWMSGGDVWDALEYVIVLSLVFQISLALDDRSTATLYLDLALAVASLLRARSPRHVATLRIDELLDKMQNFARRLMITSLSSRVLHLCSLVSHYPTFGEPSVTGASRQASNRYGIYLPF